MITSSCIFSSSFSSSNILNIKNQYNANFLVECQSEEKKRSRRETQNDKKRHTNIHRKKNKMNFSCSCCSYLFVLISKKKLNIITVLFLRLTSSK